MNTDARWTKKNGKSYYGHKNSISIDIEHGFILNYEVAPANIHDSQMFPAILDPFNSDYFNLVDTPYAGGYYKNSFPPLRLSLLLTRRVTGVTRCRKQMKFSTPLNRELGASVEYVFRNMVMTICSARRKIF